MRDRRAVRRDRVTAGRGHLVSFDLVSLGQEVSPGQVSLGQVSLGQVSLDLASLDAVRRPWPNGRIFHVVVRCSPRTLASLQGQ